MRVPSPRADNLVMGYGSSIFVARFCAEPSSRLLCLLRHGHGVLLYCAAYSSSFFVYMGTLVVEHRHGRNIPLLFSKLD